MRLLNPILLVLLFFGVTNLCHAQLFNPDANDDAGTGTEDNSLIINVTANDIDLDPTGNIDPATVDLNLTTAGIQGSVVTAEGSFSSDALGNVTFTPVLNFAGA